MPANDKTKTPIGLAIVGCGRVGRIRGRCALEYPGTEWIGCCDIDEKKQSVKVLGKGNKERIVMIGKVALNSINSYLSKQGRSIKSNFDGPLFVNNKGERLSKRTLQRRIKRYLDETTKNGSVHTLWHTFATHLMERGADILTVKELLGHTSLSTTQIYTQLNPEIIKKVYQEKHPHGE